MSLEKRKPIRSKRITQAAKDEACTWPGCGKEDGTTVPAHSNMSIHGKAGSQKADDLFMAFLCNGCHYEYDFGKSMTKEEKEWGFMRAMSKTQRRLWERGIIGEKNGR